MSITNYSIFFFKSDYDKCREVYVLKTPRKRFEFATFEEAVNSFKKLKKSKSWAMFYSLKSGESGAVASHNLPNCINFKDWEYNK